MANGKTGADRRTFGRPSERLAVVLGSAPGLLRDAGRAERPRAAERGDGRADRGVVSGPENFSCAARRADVRAMSFSLLLRCESNASLRWGPSKESILVVHPSMIFENRRSKTSRRRNRPAGDFVLPPCRVDP